MAQSGKQYFYYYFFTLASAEVKLRPISAKHYFKSCNHNGTNFLSIYVIGWQYILEVNAIKF